MRRRTLWLVTLSLVAWPSIVGADPITLINVNRTVSAFVRGQDDSGFEFGDNQTINGEGRLTAAVTASAPQGHFGSAIGRLSSSASDLFHFSGVSTVTSVVMVPSSSELPNSDILTSSLAGFGVLFQLDTPHEVDVSVRSTGTELIEEGLPSPIFSIVNPSFAVFEVKIPQFRTIFRREGLGEFHEQALLAPGRYLAAVDIEAAAETARPGTTLRAHGESVFTIDFSPAQTPEPTSIALLGSGVLGLLGIRRQNRTRRT